MLDIDNIYNLDCFEFLKSIPDDFLDLVVTSPPYAMKRKEVYGGISEDDYPNWLFTISKEVMRVLKPTGSFVINIKEGCEDGCRQTYVLEYQLLMAKAYRWVDTFIWNKTNPFPTGSKTRLKDAFEHCFHFTKARNHKFFPEHCLTKSESVWLAGQKARTNKKAFGVNNGSELNMSKRIVADFVRPSNVITFPTSCININHPAVYPPELPTFFINLMTDAGDIVGDPFMGSGTTALAAKKLKRSFLGADLKKEYVDLALSRLKELE